LCGICRCLFAICLWIFSETFSVFSFLRKLFEKSKTILRYIRVVHICIVSNVNTKIHQKVQSNSLIFFVLLFPSNNKIYVIIFGWLLCTLRWKRTKYNFVQRRWKSPRRTMKFPDVKYFTWWYDLWSIFPCYPSSWVDYILCDHKQHGFGERIHLQILLTQWFKEVLYWNRCIVPSSVDLYVFYFAAAYHLDSWDNLHETSQKLQYGSENLNQTFCTNSSDDLN
jgi:hypothetical protein